MTLSLSSGATLVLGGARSGKSAYAEQLVLASGLKPVYLATSRMEDEEMSERVAIHRERRGENWQTVEEPLALADALGQVSFKGNIILVDCLTLWISNLMAAGADVRRECQGLVQFIDEAQVPIVFVSNETGLGIVPENKLAREFRDLAGEVNQAIAAACQCVILVTAGLPLTLKG